MNIPIHEKTGLNTQVLCPNSELVKAEPGLESRSVWQHTGFLKSFLVNCCSLLADKKFFRKPKSFASYILEGSSHQKCRWSELCLSHLLRLLVFSHPNPKLGTGMNGQLHCPYFPSPYAFHAWGYSELQWAWCYRLWFVTGNQEMVKSPSQRTLCESRHSRTTLGT